MYLSMIPLMGLERILNGNCDHIPEQAFYMQGTIEDVIKKAKESE